MIFKYLKDKVVFLGNNDIASQISDLKIVLDRNGIKNISIHDADYNPIIREEVDYNLNKIKKNNTGI